MMYGSIMITCKVFTIDQSVCVIIAQLLSLLPNNGSIGSIMVQLAQLWFNEIVQLPYQITQLFYRSNQFIK